MRPRLTSCSERIDCPFSDPESLRQFGADTVSRGLASDGENVSLSQFGAVVQTAKRAVNRLVDVLVGAILFPGCPSKVGQAVVVADSITVSRLVPTGWRRANENFQHQPTNKWSPSFAVSPHFHPTITVAVNRWLKRSPLRLVYDATAIRNCVVRRARDCFPSLFHVVETVIKQRILQGITS